MAPDKFELSMQLLLDRGSTCYQRYMRMGFHFFVRPIPGGTWYQYSVIAKMYSYSVHSYDDRVYSYVLIKPKN
jgi:hypothetical protein